MTDPREVLHPTILVGFGAFGRHVLCRLLTAAASRGALAWRGAAPGSAPAERKLRDLALVHIEDPFTRGAAPGEGDVRGVGSFELMSDLYRHIVSVEGDAATLQPVIEACASELLSVSARAGTADKLRLGLDVILVAHPGPGKEIGILEKVLSRSMDAVGAKPNLASAGAGADRLCFMQILDYDNYWDRADASREAREALAESVGNWEKRRAKGQPSFGRIYLVDGHAAGGIRDTAFRVDEIALFLELLLYEGQRGHRQQLYQRQAERESPLGAFGIRLYERGSGLLGRLAAARFGVEWLNHLEGAGRADDEAVPELERRLAPFAPAALQERLGDDALRRRVDAAIVEAARSLVALDAADARWADKVRSGARRSVEEIRDRVRREASVSAHEVAGDGRVRKEVLQAVGKALQEAPGPAPLGAVLDVLAKLQADAKPAPAGADDPDDDPLEAALVEIDARHRSYRDFVSGQVSVERLRQWWYLLTIVVAAGAGPLVSRAVDELSAPDPADTFASLAFGVLGIFKEPLAAGLLVTAVSLLACLAGFHRALRARVGRAVAFHADPERGRLVDAVRRAFAPGGGAREAIDRHLARTVDDLVQGVRSEVYRETTRAREALSQRSREVAWLRDQFREFLQLHGLDGGRRGAADGLQAPLPSVRFSAPLAADFDRVLRGSPPNPARFRAAQIAVRPLADWDAEFSEALLFPLVMLDRLSEDYVDPVERERAQPGYGPEQRARAAELVGFVDVHRDLQTGFPWSASDGAAAVPSTHLCLLPDEWKDLADLRRRLDGHAYEVASGAAGRAYLLQLQLRVPVEHLRSTR